MNSADIVHQPELARYVSGWGRSGDTGFVAHDATLRKPLGAVWLRLPEPASDSLDASVPHLAFAVRSEHRRQGIGAALLTHLVKSEPQYTAVSIQTSADNPAVRLYERFGFKVVQHSPNAVMMRRDV